MDLIPAYRISVIVPATHIKRVINGIKATEALSDERYDNVLWIGREWTEQFRPLDGAQPSQGRSGEVEQVESVRIEFILPREPRRLERVIEEGIRPHHPWELPAIFVEEVLLPGVSGLS